MSQRVLLALPGGWWRPRPDVDSTFLSPKHFESALFFLITFNNRWSRESNRNKRQPSVLAGGCEQRVNVLFSGDLIDCLWVINPAALESVHHLWTFISKVAWGHSWAEQSNGGSSEHDTNPPSEPCVRIGAINAGVVEWEWGGCTPPLQSFNHNEISVSWQH